MSLEPFFTDADLELTTDERIRQIERKVDSILEKMTTIESHTLKVIEEVKPTIDELMSSSFVKMLGIGKKK